VDFKFGVTNLTESRILAVSAHAQQKIGKNYMKSWSSFQNFSIWEIVQGEVKFRSNFTPEVVLWPFLRMRTKSGENG